MRDNKLILYACAFFLGIFFESQVFAKINIISKDGEALAFLLAFDNDQIEISENPYKNLINPEEKKFAELMIKYHSQNLQDTERLKNNINIAPKETSAIRAQEQQSLKEVKKLKSLHNKALSKAYMKIMVNNHQKAINTIDDLVPLIGSFSLKIHLFNTRKISEHFEQANTLLGKIKGK